MRWSDDGMVLYLDDLKMGGPVNDNSTQRQKKTLKVGAGVGGGGRGGGGGGGGGVGTKNQHTLVTHATSAAKPSTCAFSASRAFLDTNRGK